METSYPIVSLQDTNLEELLAIREFSHQFLIDDALSNLEFAVVDDKNFCGSISEYSINTIIEKLEDELYKFQPQPQQPSPPQLQPELQPQPQQQPQPPQQQQPSRLRSQSSETRDFKKKHKNKQNHIRKMIQSASEDYNNHTPPFIFDPSTPVEQVHSCFITLRLHNAFVTKNGRVLGTITRNALMELCVKYEHSNFANYIKKSCCQKSNQQEIP
eukprot:TRINITY_DN7974_c0_g1_i4.p1 TRINITY_DN7974_c0_g1~~TRINITY_DN7974_c0_g1_i4.p1  ORF type:complete len:215 (-),score=68.03 TRINITY_DN7974_c0_g1_i4:336-980(-)